MRLFKRYNKRVMVPMVLAGAIVLGNVVAAFAWHDKCVDENPLTGSPPRASVTTQDSWVYLGEGASAGLADFVGVDANGGAIATSSSGSVTACYTSSFLEDHTSTSGGEVTVSTTDPNASSPGKMVSTQGGGHFAILTTGQTGAEAGNLTSCNATTGGNCTAGTTVKTGGITLLQLQNKTGVDDNTTFPVVTQGTTSAQNIACVGTTCVRSVKVSAGNVGVYVNRDPALGPTVPVNLCVSVGPGLGCP